MDKASSQAAFACAASAWGSFPASSPCGVTDSPSYSDAAASQAARRWFRTTRSMESALAPYLAKGPNSAAMRAEWAYASPVMMADRAAAVARPSSES